eukprot:TRINITY_DN375_c0_g1_i1.p1 TRINITY_DN375_c0_g1~~TRINITY_DN375_c0_g1_i1.p1  ORF type:complete len:388 (-),score=89.27 TRINITY_DN375_c0_g1_i1:119-1282(-)
MGSSQSTLSMKLGLKGKGLKSLESLKQPRLLPNFTRLEEVDLTHNKLTGISDALAADIKKSPRTIEFLTILKLAKNRFTFLPDCLFCFVNLKIFDVHSNYIQEINPKLLNLYQLEEFDISDNNIKLLPFAIHRMHSLKTLSVSDNLITVLPNSMGRMHHLRTFSYSRNPFEDTHPTEAYESLSDLLAALRKQPVPGVYEDEYETERTLKKNKLKKLSANGQVMKSLLSYEEGLEALTVYMKKEYSYENLSLFIMVRAFRKKYNSREELQTQSLIKDAKLIYDTHIAEDAAEQVNLPAASTAACVQLFTDTFSYPKGINQFIFDSAYKASFDLMVSDTFSRFRLTPKGKELIHQLEKVNSAKSRRARRERKEQRKATREASSETSARS